MVVIIRLGFDLGLKIEPEYQLSGDTIAFLSLMRINIVRSMLWRRRLELMLQTLEVQSSEVQTRWHQR